MSTKPNLYINILVQNLNVPDIQSNIRLVLFQVPTSVFDYLILETQVRRHQL